MNIALMTNNYKPFIGGVPISIERLAKELIRAGHEVTVFAPTYEEQREAEHIQEKAEGKVFRYAAFSKRVMGGVLVPNPFDRRIEKEFKKQRFDVIHVHHPMLIGQTAVYLSQKYNIPLAFTYHTRYEQYVTAFSGTDFFEPFLPYFLRTFLKYCDVVCTPTAGLQDYLKTSCRVPTDKLAILPTGLEEHSYERNEEKVQEIRNRLQAEDCPLFLTVARLSPEKNIDFLIESMAEVKRRSSKPFRWVIVGDGPDRTYFEEKCRSLSLTEVCFTGKLPNEETDNYYHAADAFLFASKTETQGIVLLESFAGKTPVFALCATGVEDLVKNGENGFLTSENISLYAEKVTDFLEGCCDTEALSQGAYATACDYREEAVAIHAIRLYNRIIAVRNECKISGIEGQTWKTTSITY